jgi:DNA invertase Pin-like site-specific DNA recombinase
MHGELNGHSKLLEVDVRSIRRLAAKGVTHRAIALRFGVARTTITWIVNGGTWKRVTPLVESAVLQSASPSAQP